MLVHQRFMSLMCKLFQLGTGFNELANFIFGGNDRKQSMEMTTPVLTTAGQQGEGSNRMAFVMESKYTNLESLPIPRDSRSAATLPYLLPVSHHNMCPYLMAECHVSFRVVRKQQEGCVMAALSFGGLPLDFQVSF